MKYSQFSGQVRQLWKCHRYGVDITPASFKGWLETRVYDQIAEVSDKNAKELYKHLAHDFRMDPLEALQFSDWLDFARDYGFAIKSVEPSEQ